MRDLTRLASRIVMFFMQFYYRLARHSRVSYKAYIDGRTRLAGYNTIQDNVLLAGARIGRGTYICRGSNFTDAEVGAFCSIGRNVRIVNGQHPTRIFVSTHPAFFSPNGQPGFSFVREKRYEDCRYLDRERRVSVEVGADVWIGNNVSLMSGIRIGTGAVIATGAVVVSDVAPYAIVGGVPAREIRKRFDDEQIAYLLASRWWERPFDELRKEADSFSDIGIVHEKRIVMGRPLFSIITITFNAAGTLPATLRSVERQTFTDYEYLIVDGASTDGTVAIARHSAAVSSVTSEPDKGLYDAMNKGLRKARGCYLVFLNAGDAFHEPDTLQKIADSIEKTDPDIVYGETALVDSERRFISMRRLQAPERLSVKSFRMGMLVCHQAFIVRREIAPEYDLRYRFSADFDWCIRCMQMAKTITHTHEVLIDYLNEGVTTANRKASLRERYEIMCRYYGTLPTFLRHLWFAVRFAFARFSGRE